MANAGFDLTGKVALVTGGNGGIGLGMAEALAESGADVCIWGRNEEKNQVAEQKLKSFGRRVLALKCDVSDKEPKIAYTGTHRAHIGPMSIHEAHIHPRILIVIST